MFADLLATLEWTGSLREAVPVIISLVIIEGLLSVDNALAIAAMASHLDEKRRSVAMNFGYAGAYIFRLGALLVAQWIIDNIWIKLLGALYLLWLMCSHFAAHKEPSDEPEDEVSVEVLQKTFASTITAIALMDLSLSLDNVVAAIALAHDKPWAVYVGVTIGIISLRLVAGFALKMIERYPVLEHTAFLLIGYVGAILLVELQFHFHVGKVVKFGGILTIIALSILWSENASVRSYMRPVLSVLALPMKLFAHVAGMLVLAITWPVRRLISAFRK